MKKSWVILCLLISFVIVAAMLQNAMAAGVDDPARLDYYKAPGAGEMAKIASGLEFKACSPV